MTYDNGDGTKDKINGFDDFVRMKKIGNHKQQQREEALKNKNKSVESLQRSNSDLSEQHKDRQALTPERKSGWEGVTSFLLGDPRTRKYIVDQMRIIQGSEKNMREIFTEVK